MARHAIPGSTIPGIFWFLSLLLSATLLALLGWWWRDPPVPADESGFSLALLEQLPGASFAPVEDHWIFRFPRDHAAHPAFFSEAWKLSATLDGGSGRRWGLQFTLLRLGLAAEAPQHPSRWASNQLYHGSLVLSDIHADHLFSDQRSSRAALDLAGSQVAPARVWLEDWSLAADQQGLDLRASTAELSLNLRLELAREPLLGPAQGQGEAAFHSYALPRLKVTGELLMEGNEHQLGGLAWLDRAWGAVPLSRGQQALDRFVVQLDKQRELAIFRLHRRGGGGTPIVNLLLIQPDGSVSEYQRRDLSLTPGGFWESPQGNRYPLEWQLELPAEGLSLAFRPLRRAQELNWPVRHWAGAIAVQGHLAGQAVEGVGYQELNGYSNNARTSTLER